MEKTRQASSIFVPSTGEDLVVLNWYGTPQEKLELYAEAFHMAGKRLAEQYGSTGAARDVEACPVVYLYRHALELYLKAILIPGEELAELQGRPSLKLETCINGHRLTPLAERFFLVADSMGWGEDMGVDDLRSRADFTAWVAEWDQLDQGSFSFRYPMDKKGEPALPQSFSFGLNGFCNRMDTLLGVLNASVTAVEQAVNSLKDSRADGYYP